MPRWIGLVCLLAAPSTFAEGRVEQPAWHVLPTVALGLDDFHYAEGVTTAAALDGHDGVQPRVEVGVETSSPRSHLFGRASLAWTSGALEYVGQTQAGVPVRGPSQGYMFDAELVVGGRGHVGPLMLGGFVGINHHIWNRDLTPLGDAGYNETYSWTYAVFGARLDAAPMKNFVVALDGALMIPTGYGRLDVDQLSGIDPLSLDLSMDIGVRASLRGDYAVSDAVHLLATLAIVQTNILGANVRTLTSGGVPVTDSNGDPVNITEPYSQTRHVIVQVGAGYAF